MASWLLTVPVGRWLATKVCPCCPASSPSFPVGHRLHSCLVEPVIGLWQPRDRPLPCITRTKSGPSTVTLPNWKVWNGWR